MNFTLRFKFISHYSFLEIYFYKKNSKVPSVTEQEQEKLFAFLRPKHISIKYPG